MVLTSLIFNLKYSLRFLSEQLLAALFTSHIQLPTMKFCCGSRCSIKVPRNPKAIPKSGVVKESFTLVVCWNKCIDSYNVNTHFHAQI